MQETSFTFTSELIIIILTLAIFQFAIQLYGFYDWYKQGDALENRYVWLLLVLLGNTLGVILYFFAAPRETIDKYLEEEEFGD